MKEARIAFRNLNRQKKRSFLLGGAIAFGLLIVTLINGFAGSFVENVGENFSHILAGHIFIDGVEKSRSDRQFALIRDDTVLLETLESLDLPVQFITKRSNFRGTLIFEGESLRQTVIGVDWQAEAYAKERIVLKQGTFDAMEKRNALILSEDFAQRLNVRIGDRILVQMQTYSKQQNVGEFELVAISIDPGLLGRVSCYANLEYVSELLQLDPGEYMTLGLFLEDMKYIDETADTYYTALSERVSLFDRGEQGEGENPIRAILMQEEEQEWEGIRYRFYTLNDILSEVKEVVRILNIASIIILLVLFLIIMVGVTNTFRMVMYERIREIGTMRALGMQRDNIRLLFLLEALFLSLGGALAGLLGAGVIMFALSRIFWGMDSAIFILLKNGYMTFKVALWQIGLNVAIIAILTIVAAYFPARSAAMLRPADALRTTK